jgi:hypothetical protein
MARFELVIENSRPLSFMELREIVAILDNHIAEEISHRYWPYPSFSDLDIWFPERRDFSFIEIESVRPGSIILTVIVGAAVWGLAAMGSGARRSRLGRELERFGEIVGNALAEKFNIEEVNSMLEDWSKTNRQLREKEVKAALKQLPNNKERG